MKIFYILLCTQLFFQPLLGRRMCFPSQARSSRGYLFPEELKFVSLSEETDEVREDSASRNQSAEAVILVHDKNDECLLAEQSSKTPSRLLNHKLQHWFKNYIQDFLSHAKDPFLILVSLVVSLLITCHIFFFKHLYWGIIALHCVNCCCITKWISYTYTYIPISPPSCISLPPSLSHPSRWSQSTELISLCYAAASH